ncbi:hypothetical protein U9M48_027705 [Paspalum notatum var. saurae]|uniref:Uncharacterized protein n=1 Tax=Paspalum notatum var. saurae TaxID=547442 RepID=A0AAQ3TXR3_PASNO
MCKRDGFLGVTRIQLAGIRFVTAEGVGMIAHVQVGGCDFWYWVDPAPTIFQREVLKELCDTMQALKRQNREKEDELRAF